MRCGYRTCLMPMKLPLLFQHVQYISKIKRTDDLLGKGLEFRVVLLHTHPEERGPLLEPDIYSRGTWALCRQVPQWWDQYNYEPHFFETGF